jgi:signal transduction histidine kinase
MRARFFRRAAVAALTLLLLAVSAIAGAGWLIAGRFGLTGSLAALPALLVMLATGGLVVVMLRTMRHLASPLRAVMDAADRVADGNYGARVNEYGSPPMRALAHSFNTMAERLQNADRLRRDLMADVAHELRTPLSVLQGRLEGLMDDVYPRDDQQLARLLEETHVLSRLVEDLRTLALSEAGALRLQKESTDLVALIQDVVRSLQPEADRKSVALSVTASSDNAILDLDPVRIREVLTNLLSNGLRHTPGGGDVKLVVNDTTEDVAVSVSDSGEGIPTEEVERIFDRFYKGSTSRGSGLGLTIARSIVTAHGGNIKASSQRGRGTSVDFTLPRLEEE